MSTKSSHTMSLYTAVLDEVTVCLCPQYSRTAFYMATHSMGILTIINPQHACATRVMVVVSSVCVCVCVSACLLTTILTLQATMRHMSHIISVSSASA